MTPVEFPSKTSEKTKTGTIYVPKSIYVLMNEESNDALKKYNLEALQKVVSTLKPTKMVCFGTKILLD